MIAPLCLRILFQMNAWGNLNFHTGYRHAVLLRLDGIAFGVGLAYVYQSQDWMKRYRWWLSGIGIGMVGVLALAFSYYNVSIKINIFLNTIYISLFSLAIACCIPVFVTMHLGQTLKTLTHYVSSQSYALYLIHDVVVISRMRRWFDSEEIISQLTLFDLLLFYILMSFALAFALTKYIEVPVLEWRERWRLTKKDSHRGDY